MSGTAVSPPPLPPGPPPPHSSITSTRPVSTPIPPTSSSQSSAAYSPNRATRNSGSHMRSADVDNRPSSRHKSVHFGPYRLLRTLGEGEFGKVKEAFHMENGHVVAIKLIRKDSVNTKSRLNKIEREITVLHVLKHPNIVKLFDVIETDKYIGIILECAEGGEVFELILKHRYLREDAAKILFAQLISGVNYMHKKQIVHRDLKLENLLLSRTGDILITDFGFANQFSQKGQDLMLTSCGSPCYAAPELVMSEGQYYGTAVDVWSCGVILYAMVAGYLPFDDDPMNPEGGNINALYKYIVSTKLTFPNHLSDSVKDLISHMLQVDPTKRCDLEFVMTHPWLSYPNIRAVLSETMEEQERRASHVSAPPRRRKENYNKHESMSTIASRGRTPAIATTTAPNSTGFMRSPQYTSKTLRPAGDDEDDDGDDEASTRKDPRRHTIQVEYDAEVVCVTPQIPMPSTYAAFNNDKNLVVVEGSVKTTDDMNSNTDRNSSDFKFGEFIRISGKLDSTEDKETIEKDVGMGGTFGASSSKSVVEKHKSVPVPTIVTPPQSPVVRTNAMTSNSAANLFTLLENAKDAQEISKFSFSSSDGPANPSTTESSENHEKRSNGVTPPASPRQSKIFKDNTTPSKRKEVQTNAPHSLPFPSSPATAVSLSSNDNSQNPRPRPRSTSAFNSGSHKRVISRENIFGFLGGNSSQSSVNKVQPQQPKGKEVHRQTLTLPIDSGISAGSSGEENKVSTSSRKNSKSVRRKALSLVVDPFRFNTTSSSTMSSSVNVDQKQSSAPTTPRVDEPRTKGTEMNGEVDSGITSDEKATRRQTMPAQKLISRSNSRTTSSNKLSRKNVPSGKLVPSPLPSPSPSTTTGAARASSGPARRVMDWFRRKSLAKNGDFVMVERPGSKTIQHPPLPETRNNITDIQQVGLAISNASLGNVSAPLPPAFDDSKLKYHHGAVDHCALTYRQPEAMMKDVLKGLNAMGLEYAEDGNEFKLRVLRRARKDVLKQQRGMTDESSITNAIAGKRRKYSTASLFSPTAGGFKSFLSGRRNSEVSNSINTNGASPTTGQTLYHAAASTSTSSLQSENQRSAGMGSPMIDSTSSPGQPSRIAPPMEPLYGDKSIDSFDEVRFTVELCRIRGLPGLYIVNIRRMKGNLWSYKFLYHSLLERCEFGPRGWAL